MHRRECFDENSDQDGQIQSAPSLAPAFESHVSKSRQVGNQGGKADQQEERGETSSDGDDGESEHATKKPMNPVVKIAIILGAVLVLLLAIAYGVYYWFRGSYYQSTNDAYLQADQVSIAPRISGFVDAVLVADNQTVTAGQLLVRISDRDYRARIEQDRAQLAEAQASLIETQAQMRQQLAQISQSEAQAAQSQAQERQYAASAQFNDFEVRRYGPLAASGAETKEKLASYVSEARQSRAQLDAAREQSTADAAKAEYARRQIDIYQADQVSNEAKVQRAQAEIASDQVDVDGAQVVSSIGGRVGDRTVRVGQYLQPGTRVMTIVPVGSMYLIANFKETQVGLMRVGQPAKITVDALRGMQLHGTVESFSPGTGAQFSLIPTDNATGNFTKVTQRVPVRIRIDAGPQARKVLVPGLSAEVEVDTIGARQDVQAEARESRMAREAHEEEAARQTGEVRQEPDLGAGHE